MDQNFEQMSKLRLEGKVALITGAASGIGFETCVLFAKQGCRVVCCDINEEAGNRTIRTIFDELKYNPDLDTEQRFLPAVFVKVDVSKEAQIKAAVEVAERVFGKLNIVFNNAGRCAFTQASCIQTTTMPCRPKSTCGI